MKIRCHLDDTPHYWDGFWSDPILGKRIDSSVDPDLVSRSLFEDSISIWGSLSLPDGAHLQLSEHNQRNVMRLNDPDMFLSIDSITASFRGRNQCPGLLERIYQNLGPDQWHWYIEDHLRRTYTIGGSIVFPRHRNSINQIRGMNRNVHDRWDLTLQCIKDHYDGKDSPIGWCISQDKGFFDIFNSFENYVDFFLLNDCVESDYSVIDWMPGTVLPRTEEEFFGYMEAQGDMVEKRNERILRAMNNLEKF